MQNPYKFLTALAGIFYNLLFNMKTIQVEYDYGITTSTNGNAVLFFDIVRPDGKVCRNFADNALIRARKYSKVFWHNVYLEVLEIKKTTDELYLAKNK